MGETAVKFREREEVEAIWQGWADLIPKPAARAGWVLMNPGFNHPLFDAPVERWSVELHGPIGVDVRTVRYGGREVHSRSFLTVSQEYIGQLEAETPDEIAEMIRQWVKVASLDKIKD